MLDGLTAKPRRRHAPPIIPRPELVPESVHPGHVQLRPLPGHDEHHGHEAGVGRQPGVPRCGCHRFLTSGRFFGSDASIDSHGHFSGVPNQETTSCGIRALLLSVAALGLAIAPTTATADSGGPNCCSRCGCHAACVQKTCQLVCGVKKETKTTWCVECTSSARSCPGIAMAASAANPSPAAAIRSA